MNKNREQGSEWPLPPPSKKKEKTANDLFSNQDSKADNPFQPFKKKKDVPKSKFDPFRPRKQKDQTTTINPFSKK
jgi:hypothetical protein